MNLHAPLGPAWEIAGPLPGPTGPGAAAGKRKEGRGPAPGPWGLRMGGTSTVYEGGQGRDGNRTPAAGTSSAPGSDQRGP